MLKYLCSFFIEKSQNADRLLVPEEELVDMTIPSIDRTLRIDVDKYVSHIETQNFTNGYRIRFIPTSQDLPGFKLHYTVWWYTQPLKGEWYKASKPPRKIPRSKSPQKHSSTSLNMKKTVQDDFVEIGKWFGVQGEKLPKGEHHIEVTIYDPEGVELGTGETIVCVTN